MAALPSGFGSLDPIKYISRELGIVIINNALDIGDAFQAEKLWNEWSNGNNIMPADTFGKHIFFYDRPSGIE